MSLIIWVQFLYKIRIEKVTIKWYNIIINSLFELWVII